MRVGLLIYGSLETISGGYLYDRQLVEFLRSRGDQVEMISLPWRGYTKHLFDNFSRGLLNKLHDLPLDVLIQDELNHPSLAWLNGKLSVPYPVISLVHHLRCDESRSDWQNFLYRQVERHYLDSVDGFVFNSQTTRQSVARISAVHKRPFVIATPAGDRFTPQVNAEEITQRSHQLGPLQLLFLGNLIPRKGLHTLIEALSRLPKGNFTLKVVGSLDVDHTYARRLQKQVKNLGMEEFIEFLDALDDQHLAAQLKTSQVLAVPSSYEGFGIVYLEAMGFGLPCIATTQGAAHEIITPGETGFLIDPEDTKGLSIILRNLNQHRNQLADLSLQAWKRYRQFPGWQESMAKVRNFLLQLKSR